MNGPRRKRLWRPLRQILVLPRTRTSRFISDRHRFRQSYRPRDFLISVTWSLVKLRKAPAAVYRSAPRRNALLNVIFDCLPAVVSDHTFFFSCIQSAFINFLKIVHFADRSVWSKLMTYALKKKKIIKPEKELRFQAVECQVFLKLVCLKLKMFLNNRRDIVPETFEI